MVGVDVKAAGLAQAGVHGRGGAHDGVEGRGVQLGDGEDARVLGEVVVLAGGSHLLVALELGQSGGLLVLVPDAHDAHEVLERLGAVHVGLAGVGDGRRGLLAGLHGLHALHGGRPALGAGVVNGLVAGGHGVHEVLPVGVGDGHDRALGLAGHHVGRALGAAGALVAEAQAVLVEHHVARAPGSLGAGLAGVHAGVRAHLDVTAGPHAHGDGGAVTLKEHGGHGSKLHVAQALGQVTVLVVDVAQHVGVAGEVAAGEDDALRGGQARVGVVGAVEHDHGADAAVGVLLQVLGVRGEEPLGAVVLGVGLHRGHDLVPAPLRQRHVGVAEDDGAQVVLVAGGVHDDALVGRAAGHVHLVLVHVVLAQLVDDVLQELAGVLHVGLDEALVGAALVAAVDLAQEVLGVDLGRAVGEGPGVVDGAHLAADVHVGVLLLGLHHGHGQAVLGTVLGGPGAGLAAAHDHDVVGAAVGDLVLGHGLGSGLPGGCGLGLPAVGRRGGCGLLGGLLGGGGVGQGDACGGGERGGRAACCHEVATGHLSGVAHGASPSCLMAGRAVV